MDDDGSAAESVRSVVVGSNPNAFHLETMSAAIAVVLAAGLCGVPPGNTGVFKPLQPFGAPRAGGYGLETFQIDEQWCARDGQNPNISTLYF